MVRPAESAVWPGDPVRFGVLGDSSYIARQSVIPALLATPSVLLAGVASRQAPESADAPGPARRYPSYQDLLDDPGIEAVYLPLPTGLHYDWTLRAAAAGKHVLCEKPLAVSAAQAAEMVAACEQAGVLLMEAYMTPFHPRAARLAALLAAGELGTVSFVHAAFTFPLWRFGSCYRWSQELGGGALLDLGIYCLEAVLAATGTDPAEAEPAITGVRRVPTGADFTFNASLRLGTDAIGTIECSFDAPGRQFLEIVGDRAWARLDDPFAPGPEQTSIFVKPREGDSQLLTGPGGDPYLGMVEHFALAVRGQVRLDRPPARSVALAGLVDRMAAAAAVR